MTIKLLKPVTKGARNMSTDAFDDITTRSPEKSLTIAKRKTGGRNYTGRITVRHIGGGHKQRVRMVDFKRDKFDIPGKVVSIEYDPMRNSRLALIVYRDGEKRYIVAPQSLIVGQEVIASKTTQAKIAPGNAMSLNLIPVGQMVYNIELVPGKGGQMVRSAGNEAQLVGIEAGMAIIKLPSGEVRRIMQECMATVGSVSNPDHMNIRWGKAGRTRNRGVKPTVRGKVMNPNDHPHGGGEGRNPIGMTHPKTPWGKPALGVKTRDPKKLSSKLILSRRNSKKGPITI